MERAVRGGSANTERLAGPFPSVDRRLIVAIFIGVRIAAFAFVISQLGERPIIDDYVARYDQLASEGGRPYVDYEVEYLPGQFFVFDLLRDLGSTTLGGPILTLSLLADLATAVVLGRRWSRDAMAWYLVLGAPAVLFAYVGVDPLSCLFAVGAVALVAEGRQRAGGALLAAATLLRGWPVLLVGWLAVGGHERAMRWSIGGLAAGLAVWVSVAGPAAPLQVVTFRGAEGWEFESLIGTISWIADAPVRYDAGAFRFGTAPLWARAILATIAVGLVVSTWRLAHGSNEVGRPALASVGAVLLLSPLFSFPFVMWLVPWAAIATVEARDRVLALLCASTVVLTLFAVATFPTKEQIPALTQGILLARDGMLAWLVVRCVRTLLAERRAVRGAVEMPRALNRRGSMDDGSREVMAVDGNTI
jgi:hypothetical protein